MTDISTDKKLRIAYLFQNIGTDFSKSYAAQLHILHTLRGLQERGHFASLMALYPKKRVIYTDNIDAVVGNRLGEEHFARTRKREGRFLRLFESGVRRLQSSLRLPYLSLFDDYRMFNAARDNLNDIQLIHERYNGIAVGGALASKKLGVPFILEVNADFFDQSKAQGRPIRGLQREIFRMKTRYCFERADKIICVSEQLRIHMIEKWNLTPGKTVTLECAADVAAFGRHFDTKKVRQKFNLNTEPIIIWIGGFYRWHDLDLLLESFIKVVNRLPQTKLILVGDGQNRVHFEQRVKAVGLERSVIMVGLIEHEKIPEILSVADVAVAPIPALSAQDGGTGVPLKLFEYMAAGKAIVTTNVYQSASVIQNGFTGVLVEPGNVEGFAESIIKILVDDDERKRLARNARQRAVEQHSWNKYSELLENIYYDVLREKLKTA
ncbi:MAG: glycosyltransferase family 4 protein [Chloroflexota bacterium]